MPYGVVGATMLLELPSSSRSHGSTPILYDNLDLLRPGQPQRSALLAGLATRTVLKVVRVSVHRIDEAGQRVAGQRAPGSVGRGHRDDAGSAYFYGER